ncbi:mannose-1-phosphate guanylyltransferase/mannose-6-phosphate isomerase [Sulfuricurvum sp.]|uniref:mannose-1-phosphate guanylyltransferase/mannose-6-phosphate isomerase n=1 Tax=Sulfuricurvum sp. TaxID=2025608 RepID=UPI00263239FA|nr:mannose-1-phosphate guanylyltransferase/mannose-6-phosphate isomerase [Sulfuricurvum sp.]MDD2266047.1 mannose-1-phosphate guanylyltransferase/mannose-6-phosphate isomerase [Sulfuricurvum sp.]MDD2784863.1 mannose-1-phosphate guanylyltransferase/mannose-6-phosphate isomerase [Sulfuricurvum sp.]
MIPVVAVVLSGGSGTRLWPLSRKAYPKQFLNLYGEGTMFQQTLERLKGIQGLSEIIVVANEEHRFVVAEQMRQCKIKGRILLEPFGKNTAPAIVLAALDVLKRHSDAHLLVLSSDHAIESVPIFTKAVNSAVTLSNDDFLVTFGVFPTSPETGYGYIRISDPLGAKIGYRVGAFIEKPNQDMAEKMLAQGSHYWNSGMFMFKATLILDELRQFRLDIYETCLQVVSSEENDLDFIRFDSELFESIPSESIDYAVMEHSKKGAMVPYEGMWSDVGSWEALWNISGPDESGNVMIGNVLALKTTNSYIRSSSKRVAVTGVDGLIIVATDDAVLVADKSHSQDVKDLVSALKSCDIDIVEKHQEVHRPWGFYTTLDKADRFQVKRIVVKPGEKLSFQMHYHRAEHWVIVQGTANVTLDDKTYILGENQSIHIPLGMKHSLQNPGKIPLEVIEVQSGTYLEEDDIVRFKDEYGRA